LVHALAGPSAGKFGQFLSGREKFRSVGFTSRGLLFGGEDSDVVFLIDCKGPHRFSPLSIGLPMSFTFGIDDTHCFHEKAQSSQ
jgi:hypothetical protein